MQLLKYLLCVVVFISGTRQEVETVAVNTASSCLRSPVERVFSRQRRFVLLPKGTFFKFHVSLNKRLLSLVPRGFNFVIEIALYYPTPGSRTDLLPKRLRPPTPKPTKPRPTKEPLLVYIPGTNWRYKAKPATKPPKVQRLGQGAVQWVNTKVKPFTYAASANNKWDKYDTAGYEQKYKWTPAKESKYDWRPTTQPKWNQWQQWNRWDGNKWKQRRSWSQRKRGMRSLNDTESPREFMPKREIAEGAPWELDHYSDRYQHRQRQHHNERETQADSATDWVFGNATAGSFYGDVADVDDVAEYKPMYFPDLERFDDSKHYHSHRDRRQLFHHFAGLSKILGIDMRSCVLRAICESKRLLLPPGYSMVQDILRVVFSFPTISGLRDRYSRVMQADYETCDKYWRDKCHFSLLYWLLNPLKNL